MNFRKKERSAAPAVVQTARNTDTGYTVLDHYSPLMPQEMRLYDAMRESVPVIDAAIQKLVRLAGGFELQCRDKQAERLLRRFAGEVQVGPSSMGLDSFVSSYLDSLLTYGNAVGEMVLTGDRSGIAALYNAALEDIEIRQGDNPMQVELYCRDTAGSRPVEHPELVLFSALNPPPSKPTGVSILRGLPFVSSVLLKIFRSVGQNFERMGNLRYAVTYKPAGEPSDQVRSKERAMQIAREWSDAMNASHDGQVRDFVAVGDVSIKVIGADNQWIDTEVPVRQMLEQIVAKLSIPPFMLGLSWSTTERMSKQQADGLTSELEYYRRILTPVILKICRTYLRLNGLADEPEIKWNVINLQDAVELAQAKLYEEQANQLALENGRETAEENIT